MKRVGKAEHRTFCERTLALITHCAADFRAANGCIARMGG